MTNFCPCHHVSRRTRFHQFWYLVWTRIQIKILRWVPYVLLWLLNWILINFWAIFENDCFLLMKFNEYNRLEWSDPGVLITDSSALLQYKIDLFEWSGLILESCRIEIQAYLTDNMDVLRPKVKQEYFDFSSFLNTDIGNWPKCLVAVESNHAFENVC